jgi:hypothetical protein
LLKTTRKFWISVMQHWRITREYKPEFGEIC